MIELRVLALVGLLVTMIGTTLMFVAVMALAERLRPVWQRIRARRVHKGQAVAQVRC